jgi:hypothetical protein
MEYKPYKIDGPALISFSGGRTSGFMLWNIIQAHGGTLPEDVYVTFANTGKEAPETLDFVHEIGEKWGVKIHWLELYFGEERPVYRTKEVTYETASRNGEPFEALLDRRKYLPNPVTRFCTSELKIKVKLDKPALKESVADTLMGTAINLPLVWVVLSLCLMFTHNALIISLAQAGVLTVVAIIRRYCTRMYFKKEKRTNVTK